MAAGSISAGRRALGGEGVPGVGGHGPVVSGIEASNFDNIHLSDVNTNGGGFNFGGAQGLGGHGDAQSHVTDSNFSNISFDHLNLNHGDFNFGGAQAAHFEVPHH